MSLPHQRYRLLATDQLNLVYTLTSHSHTQYVNSLAPRIRRILEQSDLSTV